MSGSLSSKSLMKGRRNSQIELSGEMFARLNSLFGAHFDKSLERDFSLFPKIINGTCVKVCATIDSDKLSPEHIDFRII